MLRMGLAVTAAAHQSDVMQKRTRRRTSGSFVIAVRMVRQPKRRSIRTVMTMTREKTPDVTTRETPMLAPATDAETHKHAAARTTPMMKTRPPCETPPPCAESPSWRKVRARSVAINMATSPAAAVTNGEIQKMSTDRHGLVGSTRQPDSSTAAPTSSRGEANLPASAAGSRLGSAGVPTSETFADDVGQRKPSQMDDVATAAHTHARAPRRRVVVQSAEVVSVVRSWSV